MPLLTQILHPHQHDSADQKHLQTIMHDVQQGRGLGQMPWLTVPRQRDDLDAIKARAEIYREQCDHVVLCGTGGSSLGARTLADMVAHPLGLQRNGIPQLHILESTDPERMEAIKHDLPLERTGWIFISKSGTTLETLTQFLVFLEQHKDRATGPRTVITMPGERPMRSLAEEHSIPVFDHAPELGGRFSVFSMVGLLPAAILGLDVEALRAGAVSMLSCEQLTLAAEAACWHMACLRQGFATQVIMPYASRLNGWTYWYRQLWAESLGKNGRGSTPLAALGPVDHHSMLQLFLDGPADKSLTTVCIDHAVSSKPLILPAGMTEHQYLTGHSGLDVINAQAYGTIQSFRNHGLPVRELRLSALNEHSLGALLMLGMLETVFTAKLLDVNAFDQPAVEESKLIAAQYLKTAQANMRLH